MDQVWGFSGEAFLVLYLVLLLAVLAVHGVWLRRDVRHPPVHAGALRALSTYHLAWTVGGAPRAVETAITALLERGAVRVAGSGAVHPVSDARVPQDPFERAVLDAADGRSAAQIVRSVADSAAADDVRRAVEDGGLVVPSRRTRSHYRFLLITYLAVAGAGVAGIASGADGLLLPVLGGASAAILFGWLLVRPPHRRTARGTRALLVARSRGADEQRTDGVLKVLFGGVLAHPHAGTRTALGTGMAGAVVTTQHFGCGTDSSATDSSGGSSGGSSCGGGCGGN